MEECKHCIATTKLLNEKIVELSLCQRQLNQYQNKQMDTISNNRIAALEAYRLEYASKHCNNFLAPITSYPSVEKTEHYDEVDSKT